MALLCIWGMRRNRTLFAISFLVNAVSLISVPVEGSHFLIDMIGAIPVVIASIALATRTERALRKPELWVLESAPACRKAAA